MTSMCICTLLDPRNMLIGNAYMVSITAGPQDLSATVLSPTSVYLTWVAPCDTQQYHVYVLQGDMWDLC